MRWVRLQQAENKFYLETNPNLFTFTLNEDGGYTIATPSTYLSSNYENIRELVIPKYYNNIPITRIGSLMAFPDYTIKKLIIPNTIIEITDAFFNRFAYSLSFVEFENNSVLKRIGRKAFNGSNLTSINLPDSVEEIGKQAFAQCELLKFIKLPANLKKIEQQCFLDDLRLKEVILPEGLIIIGSGAFRNSGIVRIVLPSSLENISGGALAASNLMEVCNLSNIQIDKSNNRSVFDTNGYGYAPITMLTIHTDSSVKKVYTQSHCYIYEYFHQIYINNIETVTEKRVIVLGYDSIDTVCTIPDDAMIIRQSAFMNETRLQIVNIPKSVTEIGNYAFQSCENLTTINYAGTRDEWSSITRGEKCFRWVSDECRVYCTDGALYMNGAILDI